MSVRHRNKEQLTIPIHLSNQADEQRKMDDRAKSTVSGTGLRYRNLAEEIRTRANSATSKYIRQIFLKLAQDYDRTAKLIEDAEKNSLHVRLLWERRG